MLELIDQQPALVLCLWLLVALGSGVQHSIGIGFGLIASPLMLVIDPKIVPVVPLALGMSSSLLQTVKTHKHLDLKICVYATITRVFAVVLASFVLVLVIGDTSTKLFSIVFATSLLLAVAMTALNKLNLKPTAFSVVIATICSSVMGTLTGLGGPPMALLYASERPMVTRSHLSFMIFTGTIITLIVLGLHGLIARYQIEIFLFFLPALIVGVAISNKFSNKVLQHFRPIVLTIVTIAAVSIIIRTI